LADIAVGRWLRVDDMAYVNEMRTSTALHVRLTLERLPTGGWDWTVWRKDRPDHAHYGVVADPAAGFAAAERAARALADEA
jgi:hypothetical protein